jgi:outer membrane protein assembly factor BamB
VDALDAATGQQIWSATTGSAVSSPPTVVDGAVIVTCDDGTIRALRAADGKLSWAYHAGDTTIASPVVA